MYQSPVRHVVSPRQLSMFLRKVLLALVDSLQLVAYGLLTQTEQRNGAFGSGMHPLVGEDDQRFTVRVANERR